MKKIIGIVIAFILWSSLAIAGTSPLINGQGTAGAPVSVTNAVRLVLPCTAGRTEWHIFPETVQIRCEIGPDAPACGTPSPAPSTTVGYPVPSAQSWNGNFAQFGGGLHSTGEVDCFSTGAATNVDTIELP